MRYLERRSRGWSRGTLLGTLMGAGIGLGCGEEDMSVIQNLEPASEDGSTAPGSDGEATPAPAAPEQPAGEAPSAGEGAPGDAAGEGDGAPAGGAGVRAVFAGPTGAADVRNLYGLTFSSVGEHAGKLYASGVGGEGNVVVLRLLADGALDESFGAGGVVDTGEVGNSYGIVELPSGELIVQGNGDGQAFLLKLDAAGALDAGFGRVAVLSWSAEDLEAIDAACAAAAAAPEDAEAVAGCTELWPAAAAPEFTQRPAYTAWDLQLDSVTTPGTDKLVIFGFGAPARAVDGVQRADNDRWVARVLASDGSLDPEFNGGAPFTVDVAGLNAPDNGRRGLIASDGSLISAGYTNFGDGNNAVVLRLGPDGTPDASFGFDAVAEDSTLQPGLTRFNPFVGAGAMAEVYSVAQQESGRIVTTGYGVSNFDIETIENDLVSFGVLADGLDPAWGRDGAFAIQSETDQQSIEAGSWDGGRAFRENGRDLVLLPDGRTLQVGCYNDYAAVFLVGPDGAFVEEFGEGGRLVFDASSEVTHTAPFFAVARSADGRVATAAQGDFVALFEVEAP